MMRPLLISFVFIAYPGLAQPEGRVAPFGQGVAIEFDLGVVEVTGRVPVDAHAAETPDVWIEVVAESGGIRDHEALVQIDASARDLHAALLLLGAEEPGEAGAIRADGSRRSPRGPEIRVVARYVRDGETIEESPLAWVIDPETGDRLIDLGPTFVFGGSSERAFEDERLGEQTFYMADVEGVAIGLCTFGTGDDGIETIGLVPVFSPDTGSGDVLWYADPDRIPEFDTPITLVLTLADPAAPDPAAESVEPE
ncbi:MAG: YdjY domain-containing protein [Planctomycetota bacterium]